MRIAQANPKYWKATRRLTLQVLLLWCLVSFMAGIFFADWLNRFHLAGYPLGFWFAQQGSVFVFVALVFFYARQMDRIDQDHHAEER